MLLSCFNCGRQADLRLSLLAHLLQSNVLRNL